MVDHAYPIVPNARPWVAGIHGDGEEGAFSIALSGGYPDDIDLGEAFTYTGLLSAFGWLLCRLTRPSGCLQAREVERYEERKTIQRMCEIALLYLRPQY